VDKQEEIKELATSFFKDLYTQDTTMVPNEILNQIHVSVSDNINDTLCKEFSDDKISDALFQIGPIKAPGPDGLPARFFQWNWALLKTEVIRAVKDFFEKGIMPEGINDTIIVLIPKGINPEQLADFRPISLCNIVYKVISKCLVNRLRPFLDGLISKTQSAFILAFEGFHKIQHSKNPLNTHCAFKLDLSKAYDRVDWNFLEGVLVKMGFSKRWVN
jgi:hypothetical protein